MIRTPTSPVVAYAWWRAILRGERPPTHEDEPHCGWFKTRLVRLGPWVPASIWLVQEIDEETGELVAPEEFACEVGGERRNPYRAWTSLAGRPIARADYDALVRARGRSADMRAVLVQFDIAAAPPRPSPRGA